jgi:hypothetical protein
MLSVESFKMANDPNVPEQLQFVKPCKLKTIFLILHGGFMVFNAADKTNLISSNGNLLQQSREIKPRNCCIKSQSSSIARFW